MLKVVGLFYFLMTSAPLLGLPTPDASLDADIGSSFETGIPTSAKYSRGRHLIYDCEKRHFACITTEEFEVCRRNRADDLAKRRERPRCAPLKAFPSEAVCAREQKRQIELPRPKTFCTNPDAGQTDEEGEGKIAL